MAPDRREPEDFGISLGDMYRGEVQKANTWRSRLDRTTNWAVVMAAAVLTWAFSSPAHSHVVLLLAAVLVLMFSVIEARRYRYFDIWRSRVRIMEEHLFERMLNPDAEDDGTWRDALAKDLERPTFKIGFMEAWARRMRRIYVWILTFIVGAWVLKIVVHPEPSTTLSGVVASAGFAGIWGGWLIALVFVLYLVLVETVFYEEVKERAAKGKIRSVEETEYEWSEL